jgi:hypothetical protein
MIESKSELDATLTVAYEKALAFLTSLDSLPVGATVDAATLRDRLLRRLEIESLDPQQVVDDLVRDVDGGLVGMPGGRFFAWVIGGSLPAALAADWLTSA